MVSAFISLNLAPAFIRLINCGDELHAGCLGMSVVKALRPFICQKVDRESRRDPVHLTRPRATLHSLWAAGQEDGQPPQGRCSNGSLHLSVDKPGGLCSCFRSKGEGMETKQNP